MNLQEIVNKVCNILNKNYEQTKEEWSQRIDYFNGLISLLWGFILAVSSTIFIQTSLYIIKNYLDERTFIIINFILVLIFFGISIYIIRMFILSRRNSFKQVKIYEKKMNSLKESIKSLERFKESLSTQA